MSNVRRVKSTLFAVKLFSMLFMSVRNAAAVAAEGVVAPIPFRMPAGETFDTAAAEPTNCVSTYRAKPCNISSRTNASAEGLENRANSCVMTMIPAAFAHRSVTLENVSDVTGLPTASPTQPNVPPAVRTGTAMLNGT